MKFKFKIGDKVKFFKNQSNPIGEIVSLSYDFQTNKTTYVMSVKAYDPKINDMIFARMTCAENELIGENEEPVKDDIIESGKQNE